MKARPNMGRTPSTSKSAGDTREPATLSGSAPGALARVYGHERKAAMDLKLRESRSMSVKNPLVSGSWATLPTESRSPIQIM